MGDLLAALLEPWAKENEALSLVWEGRSAAPDGEDDEGLAD